VPVAGQRTYGTAFRALKVTSQVATLGAESAVYNCFVGHAPSPGSRHVDLLRTDLLQTMGLEVAYM